MVEPRSGMRLAGTLWFVAALLAWIAVAIRYLRGGELDWKIAAAGLFCAAMGWGALTRKN